MYGTYERESYSKLRNTAVLKFSRKAWMSYLDLKTRINRIICSIQTSNKHEFTILRKILIKVNSRTVFFLHEHTNFVSAQTLQIRF